MRRIRIPGAAAAALLIGLTANTPIRASEAGGGDAALGAQAFLVCSACHNARPDGATLIGPNLWQVVGRPVADVAGFDYSPALKAIGGAWTPELLDRFLANPAEFAPGTRMGLAGLGDDAERVNLIAYLETLGDGTAAVVAPAPAIDFGPDWPPGPGQAEAGQLCNSCHSLTLVKQQKLSRSTWDKLLVWMVAEQGMAEQAPETRERILGYLSEHFGVPD